jgi:hypothetical protein
MSSNCLNCEASLHSNQSYCPGCGQRANIHRVSWHDVWHDALHYVTHTDKGIFFVLKMLFSKPGTVIREYLSGKRKKYMSPVTLLLICAGIAYISFNLFDVRGLNANNMPAPDTLQFPNPQAREAYGAMYERAGKMNAFMNKNSKLITIMATPLIAFFYWLFFRKAGYFFTEHLVANLFTVSATILVYALVFLPAFYFAGSSRFFLTGTTIFLILETLYRALAYYQWFGYSGWKKALKVFGVSAIVSIIWVLLSGGFTFLYIQGSFS